MDVSNKNDALAAPAAQASLPTRVEDADEISLIDILKFLRRQFKVIGGITIAAILLGLGTGLAITPRALSILVSLFADPLLQV